MDKMNKTQRKILESRPFGYTPDGNPLFFRSQIWHLGKMNGAREYDACLALVRGGFAQIQRVTDETILIEVLND